MSQLSTFVSCPAIQDSLFSLWGKNNLLPNPIPGLYWLKSQPNKIDLVMNSRPGGLREVEARYKQRRLDSSVSSVGNPTCETGEVNGETLATYTIDPTVGASLDLLIKESDLLYRCQTNKDYLGEEILGMMYTLAERIDKDYVTFLVNSVGNYAYAFDTTGSTSNAPIITQTRNADDVILENALQDVRFHFRENGYPGVPFGLGTKIWADYAIAKNAACCSQLGMDVNRYAQLQNFALEYSHYIGGLLGNQNDAIFVAPGAVQMVHFNRFTGLDDNIFVINDGALKQGVVRYPDSSLPIEFAYRAELECINNEFYWKINISLAYDFLSQPLDMYQDGDRLEGVNGISRFRISN